jgi:hypothetical protein
MGGWSADFKKGFFVGAGVLAAAVVVGMLVKKA